MILASKVGQEAADSMSHAELIGFLDRFADGEMINDTWEFSGDKDREREVFLPLIMTAITTKSVITALAHPACIGQPREWLLRRLDELVYYDGRRVLLSPPNELVDEFPEIMGLDAKRQDGELIGTSENFEHRPEVVRHFRQILDVMNWAEKNLPDVDLEAISNFGAR